MRRPRPALALLLLLAPLASLPSGAQTREAAPLTDKRLAAVMKGLAGVGERRATFREEKTLAALDRPVVSTGRLLYRRPLYFEKITTAPQAETLIVDGDRLTIAVGSEPPRVVEFSSQPGLRALVDTIRGALSGNLELLQRSYRVQAEGAGQAWRLTLSPSDGRVARFVRQVTIDGAGSNPRSIRIVQANGDESRMTIDTRS